MKHVQNLSFIKAKRSLPFSSTSALILCLGVLFLSGCGSLKEQEFKAGIFEYKVRHEIYPRVYVMDTTLFGIEATYSPEVKLPHVRAGLIHNLWFVDTSFGTETIYHYMIEVPWLFCTSNTLHVIPIKQEAAEPSEGMFDHEQELLYKTNGLARLPRVEGVTAESDEPIPPDFDPIQANNTCKSKYIQ